MLDKDSSKIREHWVLPDKYSIVKPGKKDSIKHVSEGCIKVYKD